MSYAAVLSQGGMYINEVFSRTLVDALYTKLEPESFQIFILLDRTIHGQSRVTLMASNKTKPDLRQHADAINLGMFEQFLRYDEGPKREFSRSSVVSFVNQGELIFPSVGSLCVATKTIHPSIPTHPHTHTHINKPMIFSHNANVNF